MHVFSGVALKNRQRGDETHLGRERDELVFDEYFLKLLIFDASVESEFSILEPLHEERPIILPFGGRHTPVELHADLQKMREAFQVQATNPTSFDKMALGSEIMRNGNLEEIS